MSDLPGRMLHVEERVSEQRGVLLGIDGQGGLIQRLEHVAERAHTMANDMAKLQMSVQLQGDEIREIISFVKGKRG